MTPRLVILISDGDENCGTQAGHPRGRGRASGDGKACAAAAYSRA
jgi:hypothetical protein